MTTQTARSSSRRPLLFALGGFGVLALCLCLVGVIIVGALIFLRRPTTAASQPTVEYILDASPRMTLPTEGSTRLSVARGVLSEIIRPSDPELTAGLRVFGSGADAEACQDTNLVVPFAQANQPQIAQELLGLEAGRAADAALAQAMIAAIRDLSATKGPHSLVVVTGGADSCSPQAGQLIAQEATRAGIELQTFIIGYQPSEEDAQAIKGMVDQTPGSKYLGAQDAKSLRSALNAVQKHIESTARPTAYAAQTACDQPYFPIRNGATWTYSGQDFTWTWTVTGVTGDLSNATATMEAQFGGAAPATATYHWTCDQTGVVSYEFGSFNFGQMASVMDIKVTKHAGAFLLPEDQLLPGATWDNSYTIESTVSAGGLSFTSTLDIADSYTVGGQDSITTAAGTFDALRVDSSGTYNASASLGPSTSGSTQGTFWYGRGVGLVRIVNVSAGSTSTMDLVSYSIP